ncbi:MAG: flagellar hook-basal body complex protein, partial [Candidatus Competibacteraceae bacterium]|nr:flagellar hook-basal body complex protein [Candidatus Competibacteraceae bacterium]
DFDLDFTAMTQLSAGVDSVSGDPLGSDVTLRNQDGFPLGVLESFNISANGQINGVFTNGLTRTVGVVSLATFSNVGGLSRDGNNLFRETPASGSAQVGAPQTGGRGTVTGGVLENSNVDLGSEFSNLIITQRGFQANARTITAADTLLQETVNLVR